MRSLGEKGVGSKLRGGGTDNTEQGIEWVREGERRPVGIGERGIIHSVHPFCMLISAPIILGA